MKNSILMSSMEYVNDQYIVEASPTEAKPMKRIRHRLIAGYSSLAACLCAVVLMYHQIAVPILTSLHLLPPFVHLTAQYTASEIGDLLGGGLTEGVPTNDYDTVYAPIGEDPTVRPAPDTLFSKVYTETFASLPLDEKGLIEFTDGILTRLSESVDAEISTYTVEKEKNSSGRELLINGHHDYTAIGELRWRAKQDSTEQTFDIFTPEDTPIVLNGHRVEVDFRMTDTEMEEALAPLRDELFRIFGVEFKDFRVDRNYNDHDPYCADRLTIYFYNEDDHPLNPYLYSPDSDCIEIHAYRSNYGSGKVDDPISSRCLITYTQNRTPASLRYTVSKVLPTISLSKAEELLKKGYVFGKPVCECFINTHEKIDFEQYDYVGMTYHVSYHPSSLKIQEAVPFYAFYKQIRTTENGLIEYAVTYVPAVRVTGYESYFEKQKEAHDDSGIHWEPTTDPIDG